MSQFRENRRFEARLRVSTSPRTTASARPLASRRRERMFQVRIHGRGAKGRDGRGDALGGRLRRGRHAQAFPSFGSERTGAPVVSYCRIDDREIRTESP